MSIKQRSAQYVQSYVSTSNNLSISLSEPLQLHVPEVFSLSPIIIRPKRHSLQNNG